ncbi:hypothetical protein KVV02_007880 [Mortierella alpina]|uniref:Uncharacterized protein n=1 Tax=Mortierella alpina TaxID=64518 RepID=A0A9P8CVR8_MORAP|nr:hypothetical protein KVV02_007880 [Mortierella alpina]
MYSQIISRNFLSIVVGFGLWASAVHADRIEFGSPLPNSKLSAGETVPIAYRVHHNGMAKLIWAKVHLMTEDGYDAGMGTISVASRREWQDTQVVSTQFRVPETLASGKYTLHIYGSTEQPCDDSVDIGSKCEGILSEMLPVEIIEKKATSTPPTATIEILDGQDTTAGLGISLHHQRRSLYPGRRLGAHFVQKDGTLDTQKMLYLFSLL